MRTRIQEHVALPLSTKQQKASIGAQRSATQAQSGSDGAGAEQAPAFGHRFANISVHPADSAAALPAGPEPVLQRADGQDQPAAGEGAPSSVVQQNTTGLPGDLKVGIEALSGLSMDDVRIHYGSAKPAAVQALAYTQGADIHIAPGQERHLPHEAWHVVQQKQGRVAPTMQAKGASINDDLLLEKEADVMGAKAMQLMSRKGHSAAAPVQRFTPSKRPIDPAALPIQRRAIADKPQHRDMNIADAFISTSEEGEFLGIGLTLGVTHPVLNGVELPPSHTVNDIFNALIKPQFDVRVLEKDYFGSAYMIEVSIREKVVNRFHPAILRPLRGASLLSQQEFPIDLLRLAASGAGLNLPGDAVGTGRVRMTGPAGDNPFLNQIKDHEEHHANDMIRAFTRIVGPWNERVDELAASGDRHQSRGPSTDAISEFCKKYALPSAAQVAQALYDQFVSDDAAFHASGIGKTVPIWNASGWDAGSRQLRIVNRLTIHD